MGIKADQRNIYNLQVSRVKDLNKRLTAIFEKTRDDIASQLVKYRTSVAKGGIVQPFKEERLVKLMGNLNKEIASLTGKTYNMIKRDYIKTYESTYYLETWAVEKSINTQLSLGASYSLNLPKLNTKTILAAFDKRVGGHILRDRTGRIRATTQYLLQEAVAQNLIEGQSVQALSKKLKMVNNVLESGLKNTERIARTELLKAYSLGQDEMRVEAEKSGVEFNYIWSATLDQKVRPDHAVVDNQEPSKMVDGQPVWNVGGVQMTSPRVPLIETGSKAQASQVINCRCRRLNLPFGIKPSKRAAKTKEGKWEQVNGDLTAKEWIKKEYGVNI